MLRRFLFYTPCQISKILPAIYLQKLSLPPLIAQNIQNPSYFPQIAIKNYTINKIVEKFTRHLFVTSRDKMDMPPNNLLELAHINFWSLFNSSRNNYNVNVALFYIFSPPITANYRYRIWVEFFFQILDKPRGIQLIKIISSFLSYEFLALQIGKNLDKMLLPLNSDKFFLFQEINSIDNNIRMNISQSCYLPYMKLID